MCSCRPSLTGKVRLTPLQLAVGVHGGCDVVISTIRNGVEKYNTIPQTNNSLPTRALVSLDIKNMFNSISREKLLQLIHKRYPSLSPFAETLYAEPGYSIVKRSDGTWTIIPLTEGFCKDVHSHQYSQPLS